MGYLLIETRSTWEGGDVHGFLDLAKALAGQGDSVDLFLVQNGVLLARKSVEARIDDLASTGNVSIWADTFALEQRSLEAMSLHGSIKLGGMTELIDLMARRDCKPIWHS